MNMEENPQAKKAILDAVSDQLRSPETPYVKATYDRLLANGLDKKEVMKMLGAALAVEMWEMSVQKRIFDEAGYIDRLNSLPDMSWMDEE